MLARKMKCKIILLYIWLPLNARTLENTGNAGFKISSFQELKRQKHRTKCAKLKLTMIKVHYILYKSGIIISGT